MTHDELGFIIFVVNKKEEYMGWNDSFIDEVSSISNAHFSINPLSIRYIPVSSFESFTSSSYLDILSNNACRFDGKLTTQPQEKTDDVNFSIANIPISVDISHHHQHIVFISLN